MDSGELKHRFGRRVQRLREAAGLTQESLAERIKRSVGNIERRVNATRIETAHLLAVNIGVTLPKLFDLEETTLPRRHATSSSRRCFLSTVPTSLSSLALSSWWRWG